MTREQWFCAIAALFPVAVLILILLIEDAMNRRRFEDRLSRIEQDLYGWTTYGPPKP